MGRHGTARVICAIGAAALAGLLAVSCSCGKREPDEAGAGDTRSLVEETDVLGRTLRLAAYPERIVSTAPSNTELVLQLGCRDRLVGVTRFYGWPELVEGVTRVGGYYDPSIETIMALQPNLVLVARGVSQEVLEKMQRLGLPVFCLDTQDLDDLYRDVATVGRLLGVEDKAAALVEKTKAGIAEVTATTGDLPESERPRVFWLGQEEPVMTAGPDNMINTLFELAGGVNVAADAPRPWPTYSLETLLVKDPQVIIVAPQMPPARATSADEVLGRLRAHPVWSQISAVRTGRVHLVRTDLIGQPTPRVVDGLRELAELFHPELFGHDETPD